MSSTRAHPKVIKILPQVDVNFNTTKVPVAVIHHTDECLSRRSQRFPLILRYHPLKTDQIIISNELISDRFNQTASPVIAEGKNTLHVPIQSSYDLNIRLDVEKKWYAFSL